MTGFTVVFRTRQGGRAPLNSASPIARDLVRSGRAKQVFEYPTGASINRGVQNVGDLRNVYTVTAGAERESRELLERLQLDQNVELAYVAPARCQLAARTSQIASGIGKVNTVWHKQIKLAEAQSLPQWQSARRITVSAVDSGCDTKHAQLTAIEFSSFLSTFEAQTDPTGHGTHVCGLIGASPHSDNEFCGLAYQCVALCMQRGLSIPYDPACYYRALRAASASRLINLSLGGEGEDPLETQLISDALASGAIVVSAAGNSGEYGSPVVYPAALEGVMAVGAVDNHGNRAEFSNEGDYVFISAPGLDIASTVPTYDVPYVVPYGSPPLGLMSGTSMATPIVTAVIARMLAHQPDLTRDQVFDFIVGDLRDSRNSEVGRGVIDACATLSQL